MLPTKQTKTKIHTAVVMMFSTFRSQRINTDKNEKSIERSLKFHTIQTLMLALIAPLNSIDHQRQTLNNALYRANIFSLSTRRIQRFYFSCVICPLTPFRINLDNVRLNWANTLHRQRIKIETQAMNILSNLWIEANEYCVCCSCDRSCISVCSIRITFGSSRRQQTVRMLIKIELFILIRFVSFEYLCVFVWSDKFHSALLTFEANWHCFGLATTATSSSQIKWLYSTFCFL